LPMLCLEKFLVNLASPVGEACSPTEKEWISLRLRSTRGYEHNRLGQKPHLNKMKQFGK